MKNLHKSDVENQGFEYPSGLLCEKWGVEEEGVDSDLGG